jgi:hypothetical protein
MTAHPRFIAGPAVAIAMLFVACSGDNTTTLASSTPAQATAYQSNQADPCASTEEATGTAVTVTERGVGTPRVELDTTTVETGPTTFTVTNLGPGAHELVVLRTDLAPNKLPLIDDGTEANERAPGVTLIGKSDLIQSGCAASVTFDLQKGDYVLICNLPGLPSGGTGTAEGHYEGGMFARPFRVT